VTTMTTSINKLILLSEIVHWSLNLSRYKWRRVQNFWVIGNCPYEDFNIREDEGYLLL